MRTAEPSIYASPDRPAGRPTARTFADALAALYPLPADVATARCTPEQLRPVLLQWLTVLEAADIAELEGLTDDLRELVATLPPAHDITGSPASAAPLVGAYRAALHRVGLSLERVASWGRPADLTKGLFTLGRHLLALSAVEGQK